MNTDETPGDQPAPDPKPAATQAADPKPANGNGQQAVPYERFKEMEQERNTARATANDLAERLAAASRTAASAKADADRVKALTAENEGLRAKVATIGTATAHGIIEPDLVDALDQHWRTLPTDARPASLDALLTEWRTGGEGGVPKLYAVPFLLRPHLAAKWQPAPAAEPAKTAVAPRTGHTPAASRGNSGGAALTPEKVREMGDMVRAGTLPMADYLKAVGGR
jgi:hypothetical protein